MTADKHILASDVAVVRDAIERYRTQYCGSFSGKLSRWAKDLTALIANATSVQEPVDMVGVNDVVAVRDKATGYLNRRHTPQELVAHVRTIGNQLTALIVTATPPTPTEPQVPLSDEWIEVFISTDELGIVNVKPLRGTISNGNYRLVPYRPAPDAPEPEHDDLCNCPDCAPAPQPEPQGPVADRSKLDSAIDNLLNRLREWLAAKVDEGGGQ